MVGGVITSTLMELLVYPAIFYLWRGKKLPPGTAPTTPAGTSNLPPPGPGSRRKQALPFAATLVGALFFIAGCAPGATHEENDARERAGRIGQILSTIPALPSLREGSTPDDFLRFALLKHPAVRAAYHEWRASIEDITPTRTLPDPRLTFETDISSMLMSLMPGVMFEFMLPQKLSAMSREATAASEVAYQNYAATVLSTAAEVRQAWVELAYVDASEQLLSDTHEALTQALDIATSDYATARGMAGLDAPLLAMNNAAQLRLQIATNAERRTAARARFQSALGLLPEEGPPPWPCIPLTATSLPAEGALWERGRAANPEIATMRAMVAMALAKIEAAHQAGTPDFSLGLMADLKTSPIMYRPTASVNLPIWREKIAAEIAAAEARSQGALAKLDAAQLGVAAEIAQMLFMAREAERMIAYIDNTALPHIERAQAAVATTYQTGMAPPNMLPELRIMRARMGIERLNALRQREIAVTKLLLITATSAPHDAPLAGAQARETKPGQD
jgi:outer membrane protein TolC